MKDAAARDERFPIWEALSDFFLDTELDGKDYERIANILADSEYSVKELEEILRYEVYPGCIPNLYCVAGEWAGFDPDWLQERILPHKDKRPWFRKYPLASWMYQHHWKEVSPLVKSKREGKSA